MTKLNSIIILVLTLLVSVSSLAQGKEEKVSVSIGGDIAFPLEPNTFYPGFGGTVKVAVSLTPKTFITLTSGYISFKGRHRDSSWFLGEKFIPVRIGFQYKLNSRFYVEPQAGYALKMYGPISPNSPFSRAPLDNTFNYAINVGYLINKNFDVSARYEDYILLGNQYGKGTSQLPSIGLRVAYKFKL